jgi:hypothetical protein
VKPEEKKAFEASVAKQKAVLIEYGYAEALKAFEADEVEIEDPIVMEGVFEGEVHAIEGNHLRQHVGRGRMVKHDLNVLSMQPAIGERVCIQYKNGMGFVDLGHTLETRELDR